MDSDFIKLALFKKHNEGWANFAEFRTATGYASHVRSIDFLAFPLWAKQKREGTIAYEIKISRSDFMHDVSNFFHKQQDALDLCENFYYVTPWQLVDPGETPEGAGLCWVNRSGGVIIKKIAPRRKIEHYDTEQIAALMSAGLTKVEPIRLPVKWLGKEVTQEQFSKIVDKEADKRFKKLKEYHIELEVVQRVNDRLREMRDKAKENTKAVRVLEQIFGPGAAQHLQDAGAWSPKTMSVKRLIEGSLVENAVSSLEKVTEALRALL